MLAYLKPMLSDLMNPGCVTKTWDNGEELDFLSWLEYCIETLFSLMAQPQSVPEEQYVPQPQPA